MHFKSWLQGVRYISKRILNILTMTTIQYLQSTEHCIPTLMQSSMLVTILNWNSIRQVQNLFSRRTTIWGNYGKRHDSLKTSYTQSCTIRWIILTINTYYGIISYGKAVSICARLYSHWTRYPVHYEGTWLQDYWGYVS